MIQVFQRSMAEELNNFLRFKRGLDYGYMRGEFTLREFDRFLVGYAAYLAIHYMVHAYPPPFPYVIRYHWNF